MTMVSSVLEQLGVRFDPPVGRVFLICCIQKTNKLLRVRKEGGVAKVEPVVEGCCKGKCCSLRHEDGVDT